MTNFVCFVADQLRFDMLGCAGHPLLKTPHIDRLAAEGVRFNRCYTLQPMCMATRSTWLTGLTPRGHGVRCNGVPLSPSIPTMTGALRSAGYHTHSIGKIHVNPWMPHKDFNPEKLDPEKWPEAIPVWHSGKINSLPSPYYGFESTDLLVSKKWGNYGHWLYANEPKADELMKPPADYGSVETTPDAVYRNHLPNELHTTGWAAEKAELFLKNRQNNKNPFFLWVSIPDPHPAFTVNEPYWSMYNPADMPDPIRRTGELDDLPPHYRRQYTEDLFTAGRIKCTDISEDVQRRVAAVVCGMITRWDKMVGSICESIAAHGFADNTVIVVMSDHGQMMGDHFLQNMPPSHLDGNTRVPSVWHFPKLFSQNQVSSALVSHLDFAPTILDIAGVAPDEGRLPPRPECPLQRPSLPGKSMLPLLTGKKDSVQESVIIENDEDYLGMRQRTMVTDRWHITAYIGEQYGELFDLQKDPKQLYNLWNDPGLRTQKSDLLSAMMYRFAETDRTFPRRMGHA